MIEVNNAKNLDLRRWQKSLISSVLNHSTLEILDFSKRAPGS